MTSTGRKEREGLPVLKNTQDVDFVVGVTLGHKSLGDSPCDWPRLLILEASVTTQCSRIMAVFCFCFILGWWDLVSCPTVTMNMITFCLLCHLCGQTWSSSVKTQDSRCYWAWRAEEKVSAPVCLPVPHPWPSVIPSCPYSMSLERAYLLGAFPWVLASCADCLLT